MSVIRSQCTSDAEFKEALRDDFAAKALQAMITARPDTSSEKPMLTCEGAYQFADAMLLAREAIKSPVSDNFYVRDGGQS